MRVLGEARLILHYDTIRSLRTHATNVPANAEHQQNLGHVLNEEVALVLGLALHAHKGLLVGAVLLDILLGTLEDDFTVGLLLLYSNECQR